MGFAFVPRLEASWEAIRAELLALDRAAFPESPDSLTTVRDGYDERGWRYLGLYGDGAGLAANRDRCPRTASACSAVPGLVNAGFSLFRPGTHLYPHHGERAGVLRCHLPLLVPAGDLGLRAGGETRRWEPGRCLILDDTVEHEAWNHGAGDRVVLIVTFAP
jgi:beta-hydroxylase